MPIRDLVPWNSRGREVGGRRDEEPHPILSLHREMNRLFASQPWRNMETWQDGRYQYALCEKG